MKMLLSLILVFLGNAYATETLTNTTGTTLWQDILTECREPTLGCIKRNAYRHLDATFEAGDLQVASFLKLKKNQLVYEHDENESEPRADTDDIEGVSEELREKAFEFAYTHDIELDLPDFLFGGGVLKISPRSFEDGGATLLKVDVLPKDATGVTDPRFFKKIKKFFSNKLLMALMSVLLVIKLVSVKFMFFLPMIMGVAAAKKLLLKVVLFIFPFLSYLFKLCPYYQPTKYHHHHHQISHLHHVSKPPLHGVELDHPPPGWNEHDHEHGGFHGDIHHGQDHHGYQSQDDLGYYSDGPGFTGDFISHRKNFEVKKPNRLDEENAIGGPGGNFYGESGQGQPPGALGQRVHVGRVPQPQGRNPVVGPPVQNRPGPMTPAEIENMVLKAEKEAMLKARLQEEQKRVEVENKRLQDQIRNSLKLQEKLKIQSLVAKQTSKIAAAYQTPNVIQPQIVQAQSYIPYQGVGVGQSIYQNLNPVTVSSPVYQQHPQQHQVQQANQVQQAHQQQQVQQAQQPLAPVYQQTQLTTPAALSSFDAFYSPILDKIDKNLNELGFFDEGCRERLICSMYKNPSKFSPHSNLISAELSRDPSELQKPTVSNKSVIRFYKYVQAARDGQDKRDCLRLYQTCSIITE